MKWAKLGCLGTFAFLAIWCGWEAWCGPVATWSVFMLAYASLCIISGVIVFPITTLAINFRKKPEGIVERFTDVDLAKLLPKQDRIGPGRDAWMLSLPGNESFRLRKIEAEVVLPGFPPELDGLSIVQVSDLHFTQCFQRRFFETVIDEAAGWDADLVLFTGDLLDDSATRDWIVPVLSRLNGRLGTFAILGNHDVEHDPLYLLKELDKAGYTDLEGKWDTVEHNGMTIALAGTSAPWGRKPSMSHEPEADFKILLSHAPDLYYWAERAGFQLMFSGHNHGGQIRLPLVGSVFMPSRYSRRFDRGYFRKNGLTLHVSQGVGGTQPVRYGCVPEVTRLILRSPVFTTHRRTMLSSTGRQQNITF